MKSCTLGYAPNAHGKTCGLMRTFRIVLSGIFLASAVAAPSALRAKAIIWDLGYTLFKPNKQYMVGKLGGWDALCLFFRYGSSCSRIMNDSLFDVLDLAHSDHAGNSSAESCSGTKSVNNVSDNHRGECVERRNDRRDKCRDDRRDDSHRPHDPSGRPLPYLMCDWFAGKRSCREVLEKAASAGELYDNFLDKHHRALTEQTIEWMFDPQSFAQSMVPAPGAVRLLKECVRVKDACGCPEHEMFILSNWDAESFKFLYEKQSNKKRIFNYFKPENIFISGLIGDIKPHPSIFKYVLECSGYKPEDCVFIDDQIDNIIAARALGFQTVHLKNGDYRQARRDLKKLGILPSPALTRQLKNKISH